MRLTLQGGFEMPNTKSPNGTDVQVGRRLRKRRNMLSISQTEFARALGVTHAQVHNYELGVTRIGAGRLEQISRLLGVPISFFFEDPDEPGENQSSPDYVSDFLTTSEGLALAKAFSGIKDTKVRRSVVDLVKAIVGEED